MFVIEHLELNMEICFVQLDKHPKELNVYILRQIQMILKKVTNQL